MKLPALILTCWLVCSASFLVLRPARMFSSLQLRDDDDDGPMLRMPEENDMPRISVKEIDVKLPVQSSTTKPVSATFGSLSVDDLKTRMTKIDATKSSGSGKWKDLPSRPEDLNGINPLIPLLFSAFPALMAYAGWKASSYLTANFAIQFIDSEIYPVQRLAIVLRNVVVGITTLATGFTGAIGLGLFAMGVAVAIGVMKGELDPNKYDNQIKK